MIEKLETFFGDHRPTAVVGLETRGFFLGIILSLHWMVPFVPIRKSGKLPGECIKAGYSTEYSDDTVEIQSDSLNGESKVLILDDLFATGGTMNVAI